VTNETLPIVERPVVNGRRLSWKEAALGIHQCLWCHNESTPDQRYFSVRYFGIKEGPVGNGGASAIAAWRSAYEALSA
jgi:hypothetical protein